MRFRSCLRKEYLGFQKSLANTEGLVLFVKENGKGDLEPP